jgi:diguanylate cyclase (GGDEF)-like protein
MDAIAHLNRQKANLGAFITKNALDAAASFETNLSIDKVKQLFRSSVRPLHDSGIVDNAIAFTRKGQILATIGQVDQELDFYHLSRLLDLMKSEGREKKYFFIFPDMRKREIHILISFLENDPYLVKLKYSLGTVLDAVRTIQIPILVTILVVFFINGLFASLLARKMIFPIRMLSEAAKGVGSGNFDTRVNIQSGDELEDLGCHFNYMAHELKKLQMEAENVNPLTKLPGNILIQDAVEKRIKKEEKFVVIYADLNNFKTFNDKWGLHQGDLVINMTADVIKEAVKMRGNSDDFVGHEGGDDFVVVTTPKKATEIAEQIIARFDQRIKSFYSKADTERRYFTAIGRDGLSHHFPIMGIALAGVTNQHRYLENYARVTQICAEVKKGAKAKDVSTWLLDHRAEGREGGHPIKKVS